MNSASAASQDLVDFSIINDWQSGFTGRLRVKNPSQQDLQGWTVEFTTPFKIRQLWAGRLLSETRVNTANSEGYRYRVGHATWTRNLAANDFLELGFNVDVPAQSISEPYDFRLNDEALEMPAGSVSPATLAEPEPSPIPPAPIPPAPINPTPIEPAPAEAGEAAEASIDFSVTQDWGSGFTGYLTLQNTSEQPLNNWQLEFTTPSKLRQLWSGRIVEQSTQQTAEGPVYRYVVRPAEWTQSVGVDQSVRIGFNVDRPVDQAGEPSGFVLNGRPLSSVPPTTSVPAPTPQPSPQPNPQPDPQPSPQPTPQPESQPDSQPDSQPINNEQRAATPIPPEADTPPPTDAPAPTNKPEQNLAAGRFNYGEALQKSFLFYEAQRAGALPADNRIAWRGDASLNDGADVGRDLSGGYYDAGDHVKFGFPLAGAMTVLSWGVKEYRAGYSNMGQLDEALDAIRWGTDWMLKAHVTDGQGTKEFWGQVGDGDLDHSVWGPPETMTIARPSFKIDRQNPGTDLAAETAAALASASIIFRPTDRAYADRLLNNAVQLFEFADTYRGKYSDSITDADSFYRSWSGYGDELVWGAAWLHEALEAKSQQDGTAKQYDYLNRAERFYDEFFPGGIYNGSTHSWDNKSYGAAVLLAQETGSSEYREDVERWLDSWLPGGSVAQTAGGLAWIDQWGSLRYSANTSLLASIYGDTVNDPNGKYTDFAEGQVDYILGDNPRNASYMVGFGNNFPERPHHRAASGLNSYSGYSGSQPNVHILYGALVGGPESANDFAYGDRRDNFRTNEVSLDYNAGLSGSLARMSNLFSGQQPLSDAQLNALPGINV